MPQQPAVANKHGGGSQLQREARSMPESAVEQVTIVGEGGDSVGPEKN
ncbi:hypothetical protein [Nocardia yunnanensis]|nr:hypothetical protein [Nocardia yunnanensis]